MPLTDKSKERLFKVHPLLAEKIRQLCETLEKGGMNVQVVQGLRTFAEQDELFAQGRTKPGKRVTNARGGQSNHNFGLAVDLCPFDEHGQPMWEADELFTRIGVGAEVFRLEWGGRWPHFTDAPHVQLPGLTIRDCDIIYNANNHSLQKVWDAATAKFIEVK